MKKSIFITMLLLFSVNTLSKECSKYEYANLSISTVLVYDEEKVVTGNLYTTHWENRAVAGMWSNDQLLAGNVKNTLKEYFKVPEIVPMFILNRIGEDGWEAFSHNILKLSGGDQTINEWYFKRCL